MIVCKREAKTQALLRSQHPKIMARKPGTRIRNYNVEPSRNQFGPKAVDPHSPWQLLIERARSEQGISLRALAAKSEIPSGTIFNWVRSKQGYPTRSSYTSRINNKIAAAICVAPEELAAAYNQSAFRPVDPNIIEPESKTRSDDRPIAVLERFLTVLRQSGRTSFTLAELELCANVAFSLTDESCDDPARIILTSHESL